MIYGKSIETYKNFMIQDIQSAYNKIFKNGLVNSLEVNCVQVEYYDADEKKIDSWQGDLEIYFTSCLDVDVEITIDKFIETYETRLSIPRKKLYMNLYMRNGKIYHNDFLQDYQEIVVSKEFWWQFDVEIDPEKMILYIRNFMSKGGYAISCKYRHDYMILCEYFYCVLYIFQENKHTKYEWNRKTNQKFLSDTILEMDDMNGYDFEHYCADLLKDNGFVNVEVTKASGDQGADIIAEKDGIKYAIQCKNYATPLGNTPIQEVSAARVFYNCHVGVVMTNSSFTQGAIDLANATGTLLWDREYINRLI